MDIRVLTYRLRKISLYCLNNFKNNRMTFSKQSFMFLRANLCWGLIRRKLYAVGVRIQSLFLLSCGTRTSWDTPASSHSLNTSITQPAQVYDEKKNSTALFCMDELQQLRQTLSKIYMTGNGRWGHCKQKVESKDTSG